MLIECPCCCNYDSYMFMVKSQISTAKLCKIVTRSLQFFMKERHIFSKDFFSIYSTWALSQYKDHLSLPRYGDSHVKDKTVARLSYLSHGDPYNGKTTSLYWDAPWYWFPHSTDPISTLSGFQRSHAVGTQTDCTWHVAFNNFIFILSLSNTLLIYQGRKEVQVSDSFISIWSKMAQNI